MGGQLLSGQEIILHFLREKAHKNHDVVNRDDYCCGLIFWSFRLSHRITKSSRQLRRDDNNRRRVLDKLAEEDHTPNCLLLHTA